MTCASYLKMQIAYRLVGFILLSLHVTIAAGQTKFEKELRIRGEVVPRGALTFIDSIPIKNKVKWYKEIGINRTSIEAKTRFKGQRYSIEFSQDGKLEDVEIQIKWKNLPDEARSNITTHLKSIYSRYTIDRIQIQYTGKTTSILAKLRDGKSSEAITTNYELVIAVKVSKTHKLYEYLFSESGRFLQSVEIMTQNVDNIEF
ncbi:MAG: hypothetical protein HKN76_15615 [Saprospiraceae bacterium]|nr:hypothetical protein [Saprospiraceae bacterium]